MPRTHIPSFSGSPQKSRAQLEKELSDVQAQLDRAVQTINEGGEAEEEIMANNRHGSEINTFLTILSFENHLKKIETLS